jgi:hypothetical protein
MPRIISPAQRLRHLLGYVLVLALAIMGLETCMSQPEVSDTSTPITLTPSPWPTKPPPPENWPNRWLRGIPCRPPCWEGITPGKTTANEAVEVLCRSPVIATVEMATSPLIPEEGYVTWTWVGRQGQEGGLATFDAQTPAGPVYVIEPYYPASFRLGDVMQAYGEPSHIIARSYHGPDIGSGVFYDLRIVYRSQGFLLIDGGRNKPVLGADTRFESVIFFALSDEGFQAALAGAAAYPEWLNPWQGLKDFDFYCRDEAGNPCP